MKSIEVHRNVRRCFVSCLVTIDPMSKHLIENEEFPMRRWTMKSVMGLTWEEHFTPKLYHAFVIIKSIIIMIIWH